MTEPDVITVYDNFGRQVQIPREQWRTQVLPLNLRSNWSNPDTLYSIVVRALEDGFGTEKCVIEAAKQLHAIDADAARGACVYGIVLMENRDLRAAEKVLTAALQKVPRSGALLTNLAKVHDRRGNQQAGKQTLWRALNADPNFDNALLWYAAIERESGGAEAYRAALKRVAGLRGSWRANLWLALEHLERKEIGEALALYEKVLVMAADEPSVLTQISGDLGKNGYIAEIVRLVLPFYDPKRHEFMAGSNLLQAFLELGDAEGGEKLLHEMMLLDAPPYREHLMWYSTRFMEMKAAPPQPEPSDGITIAMLPLDQPIWTNGLGDCDWLLPERLPSTRDIAVIAFSLHRKRDELLRDDEVLAGREDPAGRLTRALALHLADVLRFRTDAAASAIMSVIEGEGMAVSGEEWPAESVKAACGDKFSHAVTGRVTPGDDTAQVQLIIWRVGEQNPMARIDCRPEECEAELVKYLAGQQIVIPRDAPAVYRPPQPFRQYLDGLGQLFALALSRFQATSGLYGERNIHQWLLTLALSDESSPVGKIGFAAALANSRRRGSEVYRESEKAALAMFRAVTKGDGDLYRFTPAVFRLFDQMEEFERRRSELMPGADDRYIRWLASLETLFG